MNQIYCSTGALIGRSNGRDYRLLKEFVPKLDCDGIELMIYSDWYADPETLIFLYKAAKSPYPPSFTVKRLYQSIFPEAGKRKSRKDSANLRSTAISRKN